MLCDIAKKDRCGSGPSGPDAGGARPTLRGPLFWPFNAGCYKDDADPPSFFIFLFLTLSLLFHALCSRSFHLSFFDSFQLRFCHLCSD